MNPMTMHPNLLSNPLDLFDDHAPRRVVSLAPSITASLFDLGLADSLVAVTDYCVYPPDAVAGLPKIGGPKTPRVEEILSLEPDLVLANREENSREAVERLAAQGVPVWLAFPLTVRAALDDLLTLASLYRSEQALAKVQVLEKSVEWAQMAAAGQAPRRFFCPVWQDELETGEPWWMTFNAQTYSSDVLQLFNGVNVFAGRQRRYPLMADLGYAAAEDPGERDTRYPRVSLSEIVAAQPEVILLPDEPFRYEESHRLALLDLLAETPAGRSGQVHCVDGSLIHWPGTRLSVALVELPGYFG